MAHHNTVFVQLLRFLPRHEFEAEARQHQRGQGLRVMSRWAQFVALGLAQLTGRQSLRDIVSNLSTQGRKLYHLGVGTTVSRSSLARVNAEQPYTLYETLFGRLLSRCQQCAPRHGFRFKNKLYAVDATTIDLCLAVFPWASFRRTKAAIKLHIGLDQAGHLPSFVSVTEGKTGDVKVARTWTFPAGSVVVADRAYLDFKWFHQLQARGVTFVTRLKRGVRYRVTREHDIRPGTGVLSDQTIELTSARSRKAYAAPLRRVAYQDPVTKNRYVFVTNNTTWVAQTIADIYKSRWQIELFFKWIKQHLKVKRFVGRSKNAVMTQLWVAMCMYLLLAYLKFVMRLRWSLHQMLQVLQLNMFERLCLPGRSEKIREVVCRFGAHVPIRAVWLARAADLAVRRRPGARVIRRTSASSNRTARSAGCVVNWRAPPATGTDGSVAANASRSNSTRRGGPAADRQPPLPRTGRKVAAGVPGGGLAHATVGRAAGRARNRSTRPSRRRRRRRVRTAAARLT